MSSKLVGDRRCLEDTLAALPDVSNDIIKSDEHYCNAGAFSDVYKGQYQDDSGAGTVEVAVKSFRFLFTLSGSETEKNERNGVRKMIRRELGIWRRLKHPNIVPFLGIAYGFGRPGHASLVSLWMPNGSLQSFLEKHDEQLTIGHRLQLVREVIEYSLANTEQVIKATTQSDIYSFGNLGLLVLSGKHPWSEIQREAVVIVQLSLGKKPKRPSSRPIEDQHWKMIEQCWLPIGDRPCAKDVVSSLEQFLRPLLPFIPLVDAFRGLFNSDICPSQPLVLPTTLLQEVQLPELPTSSQGSVSTKGKSGNSNQPLITCMICQTTNTPPLRIDPEGWSICIACGVSLKLYGDTRLLSPRTDVIKKPRKRAENKTLPIAMIPAKRHEEPSTHQPNFIPVSPWQSRYVGLPPDFSDDKPLLEPDDESFFDPDELLSDHDNGPPFDLDHEPSFDPDDEFVSDPDDGSPFDPDHESSFDPDDGLLFEPDNEPSFDYNDGLLYPE